MAKPAIDPLSMSYAGIPQTGAIINGPGAKRDTPYPTTTLTQEQQTKVLLAKKYAMDLSVKNVLVKQTQVQQSNQMAHFQMNIQRQQALALMCRVYVGSINFDIREDTVRQAFAPFGPMKSCSLSWDAVLNKHKGFSFVEYEVAESAQLALDQMNNVLLGGRNIKCGRPTNMPHVMPFVDEIMKEAAVFPRIFVASIQPEIAEHDLKSVFEAFGEIVSCKLIMDPIRPTKHKGIAYIEYKTLQCCAEAINSMNLFDLGGQFIRVGRCVTPPHLSFANALPTASAVAAATASASILNPMPMVPPSVIRPAMSATLPPPGIAIPQVAGLPPPGIALPQVAARLPPPGIAIPQLASAPAAPAAIPGILPSALGSVNVMTVPVASLPTHRTAVVAPFGVQGQPLRGTPEKPKSANEEADVKMVKADTRVLVLKNMVGPEDVDEELETEVTEECANYGAVDKVIIYQEKQGEDDDAEILVKIFVEFSKPSEMLTAARALDGRFFGGRRVQAVPYEQALYDSNDLSH